MSTVEGYAQGAPCWIDLVTADVEGARTFYEKLFGWSYDAYPMPGDATYYMSTIDGRNVAGLMQQQPQDQSPTAWQTYFAVEDADATAARATAAGATLLFPVDEIPGSGRLTFAVDPQGGRFGLWQSTGHIGTAVAAEAGAPIWHELQSGDPSPAAAFYATVFGVEAKVSTISDLGYTELIAGGRSTAGIMPKQSGDEPTVWLVYFGVDDPDESVRLAETLGAAVLTPAFDIDGVGRMAVLADPQGGVFAVMRGMS